MPTYIIQGRYSHEAMKGMVAKPEDRAAAVAKLLENAGGRLVAYYMTFGPADFHVTVEMPDEKAMLSVLGAAAAGPGVVDLNTCLAIPADQAMAALSKSKGLMASFRSAGSG